VFCILGDDQIGDAFLLSIASYWREMTCHLNHSQARDSTLNLAFPNIIFLLINQRCNDNDNDNDEVIQRPTEKRIETPSISIISLWATVSSHFHFPLKH